MKYINKTMKQNNNNKLSMEIYQPKKGLPSVEVHISEETVWLNANQIALLLGVNRPAIVKHINNIYKSDELKKCQPVPFWNGLLQMAN